MSRNSKEDSSSAMSVGTIQSIEGSDKTEKWRKGEFPFPLLKLGCPSSPVLGHQSSDSLTFVLLEMMPPPQAVRLRLCWTGFCDSPACRGQTVELLSLHHCVSQFP